MSQEKEKSLLPGRVEYLFASRRDSLRAFFRRRMRSGDESSDLAQEAFTRVLRASSSQVVLNPEAYLFAVAANLVCEQAILRRRFADTTDINDPSVEKELCDWPDFEGDLDAPERHRVLIAVLEELSPKCRAAVVLQFRDGLTYQQIGERLGVSSHMVKKYLSNALRHCRKRLGARRDLL